MKVVNFTKPFWLISDTHFYHTKLFFEFGLRKEFKSTEEVNKLMFDNWNNTVTDEDYIFFLGDFVIGCENKYETAQIIYNSLNGKKIFLKGNHDEKLKKYTKIPVIEESLEILYNGKRILLNHKPIWDFKQDLMICGHIHNSEENQKLKSNMFNVSVEMINYTPIHIDEIFKKIKI